MAATDSLSLQYSPTRPLRRQCALCPGYPQALGHGSPRNVRFARKNGSLNGPAYVCIYKNRRKSLEWPENIGAFEWDEQKRRINLREHGINLREHGIDFSMLGE